MARLNVMHSGMAYHSQNAGPYANIAMLIRGDLNEENGVTCSRYGTPGGISSTSFLFGLADAVQVNQQTIFFCFRFRVRSTPLVQSTIIGWNTNGGGTNSMHMDITTGNLLNFYNGSTTANLIVSSSVISVGNTDSDWHTVQGRVHVETGVANQATLTLIVDGTTIITAAAGTIPGATGLNLTGSLVSMNMQALPGAGANGLQVDFDQLIVDDAETPSPSRFTQLRPTGAGNYSNWLGGTTNFRNVIPQRNLSVAPLSTALTATRQSYTIQTPASAGVTGTIKSVTITGYTGACPIGSTLTYFFRKGGVDTDCATACPVDNNERTHRALFASPGWSTTDTLEIGFLSGAGAGTYNHQYIGVWIEHDTAFVPPAEEDVMIERGNYTGNGTFQTITPPFPCTFIFIAPRTASDTLSMWFQGMDLFSTIGNNTFNVGAWTDGTRIELNGNVASFNTSGQVYDVLYIQDFENRIVGSGGAYQLNITSPVDTDNYQVDTPMADPAAVMVVPAVSTTGGGTYNLHHTSMGTNLVKPFTSAAMAASVVQLLNSTGFQYKRAFFSSGIHFPFVAWKPAGHINTTLSAIVQYTGDGAGSQVVSLPTLAGATPFWAWVFPHTNVVPYSRNDQQSGSFGINGTTGSVATAITAFGVESITVGSTLNSNGVVYTVFAFVEGTDSGQVNNQYSGIYFIDPTATHDTLWDRSGAPVATVDLKIPNPLYRTHYIRD